MIKTSTFPLENLDSLIWLDGKITDSAKARLHPINHSMQYGGGVFEGLKAADGNIFKLEEHTSRLFNSARLMKLGIDFSEDEVNKAHYELLAVNNLKNAYFRPFVWRDDDTIKITPQNPRNRIMIVAWEIEERERPPMKVTVSTWIKPGKKMFPHGCKSSAQYGLLSLAGLEAANDGFDDAILLDEKGFIAECTSSNIFFLRDNTLFTPQTNYCLDGITRQTIINIASDLGFSCDILDITTSDLTSFDAAFVTGTAVGLREISQIVNNDHEINFVSSEVFHLIKKTYDKMARGIND